MVESTLSPENKGAITDQPGPESLESTAGPVAPSHAAPAGPSMQNLDTSLVRGVKWTALVQWIAQIFSWFGTIIVARLLTPADFGLVGMATIYTGFTSLVSEFGLGSAIVLGRQHLDEGRLGQLNTIALRNGLVAFALSALAAWPLGIFFHNAAVGPIVLVLGTGFIFESLRLVPTAILKREFAFKPLAFYEAVRISVANVLIIVFAVMGMRHWSIVWGNLLGSVACTAMTLMRRPVKFRRPRGAELTGAMSLSRTLLYDRASWYFFSNTDFIVAGRVIGSAALGAYSYAWQIASLPGTKVLALLSKVTPSVFAAVKHDPPALRRYLLVLSETLSAIIFPLVIGLGLTAGDFVHVVLGPQWAAAVLPMQLLALYAAANMVMTQLPVMLQATGHEKWAMRWSVSRLFVLPPAFWIAGTHWGINGIATAWLVIYPWFLVVLAWKTLRVVGLPAREYLASFWPAVSATIVMALAVIAAGRAVTGHGLPDERVIRLGAEVVAGAAAYLLVATTVHRSHARALYAFWRHGGAAKVARKAA